MGFSCQHLRARIQRCVRTCFQCFLPVQATAKLAFLSLQSIPYPAVKSPPNPTLPPCVRISRTSGFIKKQRKRLPVILHDQFKMENIVKFEPLFDSSERFQLPLEAVQEIRASALEVILSEGNAKQDTIRGKHVSPYHSQALFNSIHRVQRVCTESNKALQMFLSTRWLWFAPCYPTLPQFEAESLDFLPL